MFGSDRTCSSLLLQDVKNKRHVARLVKTFSVLMAQCQTAIKNKGRNLIADTKCSAIKKEGLTRWQNLGLVKVIIFARQISMMDDICPVLVHHTTKQSASSNCQLLRISYC